MTPVVPITEAAWLNPGAPRSLATDSGREVHFLPMADVSEDGTIRLNGTRRLGEVLKGYSYFENGDILIAKITPCMENGKAAYVEDLPLNAGFGSTEFHVLRPKPGVCGRYLFFMLWNPWFRRVAERNMTGTAGQKRVPSSFFETFKIPLPSEINEQKRIASILNKADAIRRKRKQALELMPNIRTSVFLEMFGDPVLNPKGWPDQTFDAHIKHIQYGPRFFNQPYTTTGPRIVRITDLDRFGGLDYESMPRMEVSEADRANYCLKPGDLILARSGATVGKTALIDEAAPECIAGAYFIRLRFGAEIHPRYAQMVFASHSIQSIIAYQSRQSAQQNFNGPAIRRLPLPRPPFELQEEFAKRYDSLSKIAKSAEDHLRQCSDLFQSLIDRAFRGEL